ncbi:MAG: hypothetical protein K8M05_00740 [Deltaproteobacteria bacterium]|nr:hypothetical protein [Kofleriaceae bacterium]
MVYLGSHDYGRVHGYAGEYAVTRFLHLWFLPIVPLDTMWVTGAERGAPLAFSIRRSGRSLAAAYLRVWGPLVMLAAVVGWNDVAAVSAAIVGSLMMWSWTWRSVHGRRAQQRAWVHRALFGTACDPARMSPGMAAPLRAEAETRFAELSGGKTPTDIARLGADSHEQAYAAYALLRTSAALLRGQARREAIATSERVLAAPRGARTAGDGGPYRRRARGATS